MRTRRRSRRLNIVFLRKPVQDGRKAPDTACHLHSHTALFRGALPRLVKSHAGAGFPTPVLWGGGADFFLSFFFS